MNDGTSEVSHLRSRWDNTMRRGHGPADRLITEPQDAGDLKRLDEIILSGGQGAEVVRMVGSEERPHEALNRRVRMTVNPADGFHTARAAAGPDHTPGPRGGPCAAPPTSRTSVPERPHSCGQPEHFVPGPDRRTPQTTGASAGGELAPARCTTVARALKKRSDPR